MMRGAVIVLVGLIMLLSGRLFAQTTPLPPERSTFMVTGYGFTTFEKEEEHDSNFEAAFNPIFLWKPSQKFLFEGEVEFEIEEEATGIELEYAQILYFASDYLTFGVGKFLSPNNMFIERLHPAWINKLPDMPLGLSGHGVVPLLASTQLGVQVRGGIPLGASRLGYALYLSHGPELVVEEEPQPADIQAGEGNFPNMNNGEEGEEHEQGVPPGFLNFENIPDNNDNKALGGRISFLPVPQVEIGYGFETARVGASHSEFEDIRSLNQVVDFTYVSDIAPIKGRLDIRGQWVWLKIDRAEMEPLNYDNTSNALFAQLAYQPYHVQNAFFKNLEFVFRYDQLDLPEEAELNVDLSRISFGLNYWFTPSAALKLAVESMTEKPVQGEQETESRFLAQFTVGF